MQQQAPRVERVAPAHAIQFVMKAPRVPALVTASQRGSGNLLTGSLYLGVMRGEKKSNFLERFGPKWKLWVFSGSGLCLLLYLGCSMCLVGQFGGAWVGKPGWTLVVKSHW